MPESADYEREIDEAALRTDIAGMHRHVTGLVVEQAGRWQALVGDLQRIDRVIKRLGVDDPKDLLELDIEQDRDRLVGLLGEVVGALELALKPTTIQQREACRRILARAKGVLS